MAKEKLIKYFYINNKYLENHNLAELLIIIERSGWINRMIFSLAKPSIVRRIVCCEKLPWYIEVLIHTNSRSHIP